MSVIRGYFELTNKCVEEYGELSIVLMQNGAFFEVYALKDAEQNIHGSKLCEFAKICDLNIVERNMTIDNEIVVNAGFKTHLIDKYVKKIQEQNEGYTIAVYEEVGEDPIKKGKIREQTALYSPGTYFYTEEDNEQITNNTCCLWIEHKKGTLKNKNKNYIYIGIGIIDIFTGQTIINEFNDEYIKNPTTFDDLERFISIHKPVETIIISNLDNSDIEDVINYINLKGKSKSIHVVSLLEDKTNKNVLRALNCEKQTYQSELLSKFYEINDLNSFMGIFYDNVYATQAFCFLLDFVFQHNPYLVKSISQPSFESNTKKMILANHSLKQLNIIDDYNYKGKYSSVSKMLNECITPMGKRKFTDIFLNPVTDIEHLNNEYDTINIVLTQSYDGDYGFIKSLLVCVKDISKIMRQIVIEKASPKSLYKLYESVVASKQIHSFIKNNKISEFIISKIPNFVSLIEKSDKITNYLEQVLNIDLCKNIDNISKIDESFIKPGVDEELDEKIKILTNSQEQLEACRSYFSSLISDFETSKKDNSKSKSKSKTKMSEPVEDDEKSYVNIHETDKNNFSLCATERRCKILEECVKNKNNVVLKYSSGYLGTQTTFNLSLDLEFSKQTSSNKSITNAQIATLCKNVGSIKQKLIGLVTQVYQQKIIKRLQEFQRDIESVADFITYIDVIYCKACIARKYNHCKPEIQVSDTGNSYVKTTDLRHCLIEKIQQTELYIGNDINIGNYTGNDLALDGVLLYGTNAVGKTSFIRALGVAVIMAQAGLYVPATTFIYMPYKYIFTRILGNDNIFKGLSTFAVEMSELRTILRLADKNSLVLGDELCSGTESISAVSIFVAGVQKMASVNCSFIFATHLHEIIGYDEITSLHNVGMKHMTVIYDNERDCLIYNRKLKEGPGTNMYGLEVCKSLNLPEEFLENAHKIRMKYHPEGGSILEHKGSQYNSRHIKGGMCDNCKVNVAVDVHHLIYQNEADDNGTIKKKDMTLKKNAKANLANLCEKCHDDIHKNNKKMKKTKTTKGVILEEI